MNEETTAVIGNVAGEDVLPLVDVLKGKRNVSEFTIAEELKEEINTIRNKLYRLYDFNLVEFTRKKDKKKGWYIYYWTFVPSRIPYILKEMKKKQLNKIKQRLVSEENTNFFTCKNECVRQSFEKAMDHEFKCPECGELMNQEDNLKKVELMKKEIDELEKEILAIPEIIIPEHQVIEVEELAEKQIVKKTTEAKNNNSKKQSNNKKSNKKTVKNKKSKN